MEHRELRFYHRPDDPWSHLLLQILPRLVAVYDVTLSCITVPLPPREYFPRPDLVARHALGDARDLTRHYALEFKGNGQPPRDELTALASRRLLCAEYNASEYVTLAKHLGDALFAGDEARVKALSEGGMPEPEARSMLVQNQRRQIQSGHYNSAMISFGNNWYWGLDRLSHLEHDLLAAGRRRPNACVGVLSRRPAYEVIDGSASVDKALPSSLPIEIDFFCSFRSPYAYLAARRCFDLQHQYPVRIRPRLILPMKMAGFTIPELKAAYFRVDPAREALRHGIRFGNFCDPFGKGLERAMALVEPARQAGQLEPYVLSVMQGVWADGIDTATDVGLRTLVERANLDWTAMRPHLEDESWRVWATDNRNELERLGQYAAPTWRIGDWVTWGQDRLWMIEREIAARVTRAANSGGMRNIV
jgi:2-hydroxychromene-2-carboxylate isomerase